MSAGIVEGLIRASGFDHHDADLATSGLCGTFALALYRELHRRGILAQIVFLCVLDGHGDVEHSTDMRSRSHDISWRHVMIEVEGRLFDVDGPVEFDDAIVNYCWGHPHAGGKLVRVGFKRAADIIRELRGSSYDRRSRVLWGRKLRAARPLPFNVRGIGRSPEPALP